MRGLSEGRPVEREQSESRVSQKKKDGRDGGESEVCASFSRLGNSGGGPSV